MTIDDMRRLRAQGLSFRQISDQAGIGFTSVFYRLGGRRSTPRPANDNRPGTFTKMIPYNGGCSTTSEPRAVTLASRVAA